MLIAPVLVAIVLLLIAAGRVSMASVAVESAAAATARAVSLSSSLDATTVANDVASATLTEQNVPCSLMTVTVDAAALDADLGVYGSVEVEVTCVVSLGDVALPGLGGSRTLTATATSPVDPFRAKE